MGRLALLLSVFFCVGCNMPSPAFRNVPPVRVTVDGSIFDVRILESRAEAMRISAEYAPRFGPIQDRARQAMEMVSGCEVKAVTGDQALAFGRLKCKGKPAPPTVTPVEIECYRVPGSGIKEIGGIRYDLECEPA